MEEKKLKITAAVLAVLLAVIMAVSAGMKKEERADNPEPIENSQEPEENEDIEMITEEWEGRLNEDEMSYADEQAFQALKEIYEGIDFHGEFKKGDLEVYDYYKEKYAKLLNGEAKITDVSGEEYDLKHYGYKKKKLTSTKAAKLYFFDMDEDSRPELCIAGEKAVHVIKYNPDTDQYQVWWEELNPDGNIAGSRKIKTGTGHIEPDAYNESYIFYSFSQLTKSGDLDYWTGFGIDGYDFTPVYMVSWPIFETDSKRVEIPKEVKNQSFIGGGPGWKGYYFRVTKEQYEELTAEYFKADMAAQWQRVSLSYFLPELGRTYGSYREFPFDMPYADEPVFRILETCYKEIDFHSSFDRGETKYYEKYKEKYRELLTSEAAFTDEDESGLFLENYIYDLDVLKDISTRLYYFDMDGDGQPELCIETTEEIYVFKYSSDTDQFRLWWYTWDERCEIAGRRQIREKGDAFHKFYEWKEDGTERFNVMFGVMEAGDSEDLYIVSLPSYEDKTANPEIPEAVKEQSYVSMEQGNNFFRVTKKQYEKLTREYFETNMDAVWRRVSFSFFFT